MCFVKRRATRSLPHEEDIDNSRLSRGLPGGGSASKRRLLRAHGGLAAKDAVQRLADKNGWTVRRIKIDDGCYEVDGRDAEGRGIEVTVHPATLDVIEVEYDDEKDDDKKDDDRAREDRKLRTDD